MRNAARGDRLIALFVLGMLAFSPALLAIFAQDRLVLGVPLLFLYLFGAWVCLVALLAWCSGPDADEDVEG